MSSSQRVLGPPAITRVLAGRHLKRSLVVATVAVLAGALLYMPGWGSDDLGQMELQVLSGEVVIARGGEVLTVQRAMSLRAGDEIHAAGGEVRVKLRLADDRRAELTSISQGSAELASVVDDSTLNLRVGHLKVASPAGDRMSVTFDGVLASPLSGATVFRVDRGFGFARAAVYAGELRLSRPGQDPLAVSRYFQAAVAGGDLPLEPTPYVYSSTDRWDRTYMARVIELDQDLQQTASSLTTQLGRTKPSLPFFRSVTDRSVAPLRGHLSRATDDLLIGFSIGLEAQGTPFTKAVRRAFALSDAGGQWGVVASILNAPAKPVLAQLGSIVLSTGVTQGGDSTSQPDLGTGGSQPGAPSGDGGNTGGGSPNENGSIDDNPTDDPDDPSDPGNPGGGNDGGCTGPGCEIQSLVCGGDSPPALCPGNQSNPLEDD